LLTNHANHPKKVVTDVFFEEILEVFKMIQNDTKKDKKGHFILKVIELVDRHLLLFG
jgi:hypothetical protein